MTRSASTDVRRHLTEGRIVAALLALAAAVRTVWLIRSDSFDATASEVHFIASALARTGQFSDAFAAGTGPTAHLVPTTPLFTALVYRLFGVGSPLAMAVLSACAIAVVLLGMWLSYRFAKALDVPVAARLAALAMVALLPLQFSVEVREFRSWEGGVAAALVAAVLLWVLRLERTGGVGWRQLVLLGLTNGVVALISLPGGLATSGIIGVLLLRRVSWRRWPVPVMATLAVLVAVVVPWSLRNERVLGAPVPLRTGLGISLALTYNDDQLRGDRGSVYRKRFVEVSPLLGRAARAEYLRVGEAAYDQGLRAEAQDWMARHPDVVRRLRLENLRDFYFPPAWQFDRFGGVAKGKAPRLAIIWGTAAAGLLTLVVMLLRRRWLYLYAAAAVALPCLPYIMTFSLIRYRYLISTLLIFLALDGTVRLVIWLSRRQSRVEPLQPVT